MKIKPIRQDLANHIFYFGILTYMIVSWVNVVWGVLPSLITISVLMALFGLFELYQHFSKTGTGSVTDWLASCFVAFILGTNLLITYTT